MKRLAAFPMLTIAEVVHVASRVGVPLTARQLRLLAAMVPPAAMKAAEGRNAAHVFALPYVVLAVLVGTMRADDVPARAVWGFLVHHADALEDVCGPGTDAVVWVEPSGRSHVLSARAAEGKPARECYRLAPLVDRVIAATTAIRRTTTEVWNGQALVPVQELAAV